MIDGWPTTTDLRLQDLLTERGGTIVRTFGERRDSRSLIVGIEGARGERYVVKHAEDREAIAWLESALAFTPTCSTPRSPPSSTM